MPPYRADPDEGPSPSDLRQFAGESGYCPSCGNSVHDDAEVCSGCGSWITGQVASDPPLNREAQGRFRIIVVVAVLLAFGGVALGIRIF